MRKRSREEMAHEIVQAAYVVGEAVEGGDGDELQRAQERFRTLIDGWYNALEQGDDR